MAGPALSAASYAFFSPATLSGVLFCSAATHASPVSGSPVSCWTRSRNDAPLPGLQYTCGVYDQPRRRVNMAFHSSRDSRMDCNEDVDTRSTAGRAICDV